MDVTEVLGQIGGAALVGVPALLIIGILFQLLKQVVPGQFYWVLAILLGILVMAGVEAVNAWPSLTPYARVVVFGIVFGFATSGSVSLAKRAQGFTTAPPGTVPVLPGTVVTPAGEAKPIGGEMLITVAGNQKEAYTIKEPVQEQLN